MTTTSIDNDVAPAPRSPDDQQFSSEDLGAIEAFLVRNYTNMSIGGVGDRTHAHIDRRWLGEISHDELEFSFDLSYDVDPMGRVSLCRTHSGSIELTFTEQHQELLVPGDVALLSWPDLPFSGQLRNATYDLTLFDPALLNRVASPEGTEERVRLLGQRPHSERLAKQLNDTIDRVRAVSRDERLRASPLVASTAASHLAAMVIAVLPTNAILEPSALDRLSAKPAVLRRAAAYIDANSHTDIALADIAAAVHVTPRALQYMFRRHLDMTPMEYLRRVRLDHAHRQLVSSDPTVTSVTDVAVQWGFAHTGRFSALYRKTYGRNPSVTLKN